MNESEARLTQARDLAICHCIASIHRMSTTKPYERTRQKRMLNSERVAPHLIAIRTPDPPCFRCRAAFPDYTHTVVLCYGEGLQTERQDEGVLGAGQRPRVGSEGRRGSMALCMGWSRLGGGVHSSGRDDGDQGGGGGP